MIGTFWTHLKRGTSYEVVGIAKAFWGAELSDDDIAFFMIFSRSTAHAIVRPKDRPFTSSALQDLVFKIPILVQISCTTPTTETEWVIYRNIESGDFYARPKDEFTPDRFVQHT